MAATSREPAFKEAVEIARYFWEWRYKLLTYSLTLNTALFTAAAWTYTHASHGHRWLSLAPLLGGLLTSVLLAIMDHRNSVLLDMAYRVAAPIEQEWLTGLLDREGNQVDGFYRSMRSNVGSARRFSAAWRPTTSSYTVILRWWFTITAVAYGAAALVVTFMVPNGWVTWLVLGPCAALFGVYLLERRRLPSRASTE